ncbi:unnamed protein product [Cyprideis torosa]|uniref:Protein kinase domain-containing protein n=1 Tax=Cyprideis torosa TaxID=163714 RepID=A0A7R8WBJ0_9CRUS|nr:unnamed protein product [Cyprideis torosa]CAG0889637.1 unnamed protein product [Cyprideis torosa]
MVLYPSELSPDMELRHLDDRYRRTIGLHLDQGDLWKVLMTSIPMDILELRKRREDSWSEVFSSGDSVEWAKKYSMQHLALVENEARRSGRLAGDILLDEWSCSGRIRPTLADVLDILTLCGCFTAADYLAVDLLGVAAPKRPRQGPDAPVSVGPLSNVSDFMRTSTSSQHDSSCSLLSSSYVAPMDSPLLPLPFAVISAMTDNFSESRKIGSGSFGDVFLAYTSDGFKLAVKRLKPIRQENRARLETALRLEVESLPRFDHPNLVALRSYCLNSLSTCCLIFEFMPNGSLQDWIECRRGRGPLSPPQRLQCAIGAARGLAFLHTGMEKPLIHRDVKPGNILLDENLNSKVADFGLARFTHQPAAEAEDNTEDDYQTASRTSMICGTTPYMPYEAFIGEVSPAWDTFSLGVVVLQLLTGKPPLDARRSDKQHLIQFVEETLEESGIGEASEAAFPVCDDKGGQWPPRLASLMYRDVVKPSVAHSKALRPQMTELVARLESIANIVGIPPQNVVLEDSVQVSLNPDDKMNSSGSSILDSKTNGAVDSGSDVQAVT